MPEPPTAADIDAWNRFGYCCACLGCEDHQHVCDRTEQERDAILREHDEAIDIAMTRGPGKHQRADGSWLTIKRPRRSRVSEGRRI